MIDQKNNHCPICDCIEDENEKEQNEKSMIHEQREKEETSFAVLLALVPAMTMTLFNLMGLI